MIRRVFWVALGAAAGIYVVRRLTRKAERLSPEGLARQVSQLGGMIRTVGEEIRTQMGSREQELRAALGLPDAGPNGHHDGHRGRRGRHERGRDGR